MEEKKQFEPKRLPPIPKRPPPSLPRKRACSDYETTLDEKHALPDWCPEPCRRLQSEDNPNATECVSPEQYQHKKDIATYQAKIQKKKANKTLEAKQRHARCTKSCSIQRQFCIHSSDTGLCDKQQRECNDYCTLDENKIKLMNRPPTSSLDEDRWYGSVPFCKGDCPKGATVLEENRKYCWTGRRVRCGYRYPPDFDFKRKKWTGSGYRCPAGCPPGSTELSYTRSVRPDVVRAERVSRRNFLKSVKEAKTAKEFAEIEREHVVVAEKERDQAEKAVASDKKCVWGRKVKCHDPILERKGWLGNGYFCTARCPEGTIEEESTRGPRPDLPKAVLEKEKTETDYREEANTAQTQSDLKAEQAARDKKKVEAAVYALSKERDCWIGKKINCGSNPDPEQADCWWNPNDARCRS